MKPVRRVLFWLHLFAGCVAGVVILIMSITGAILAFERQIKAHMDAPAVLQPALKISNLQPQDGVLGWIATDANI